MRYVDEPFIWIVGEQDSTLIFLASLSFSSIEIKVFFYLKNDKELK